MVGEKYKSNRYHEGFQPVAKFGAVNGPMIGLAALSMESFHVSNESQLPVSTAPWGYCEGVEWVCEFYFSKATRISNNDMYSRARGAWGSNLA